MALVILNCVLKIANRMEDVWPGRRCFYFREPKDDSVPLLEWLDELPGMVKCECTGRIDRLGESVIGGSNSVNKEREVPGRWIEQPGGGSD